MNRQTAADLRAAFPKRNKYHVAPREDRTWNGMTFDSKAELHRYLNLRNLERAGKITNLKHHVEFPLEVNGLRIGKYEADFCYFDCEKGERVVEDCKGVKTAVYRLKAKLMKALYGITITETRAR